MSIDSILSLSKQEKPVITRYHHQTSDDWHVPFLRAHTRDGALIVMGWPGLADFKSARRPSWKQQGENESIWCDTEEVLDSWRMDLVRTNPFSKKNSCCWSELTIWLVVSVQSKRPPNPGTPMTMITTISHKAPNNQISAYNLLPVPARLTPPIGWNRCRRVSARKLILARCEWVPTSSSRGCVCLLVVSPIQTAKLGIVLVIVVREQTRRI